MAFYRQLDNGLSSDEAESQNVDEHSRSSEVFFDKDSEHLLPKEHREVDKSYREANKAQIWRFFCVASLILNGILIGATSILYYQTRSRLPPWPMTIYSPADEAISYETRIFDSDFGHQRSDYVGVDTAADKAWDDLYEDLIYLNIPTNLVKFLPNATSPHPRAPELSLIGLDVFHQLHCLNAIRKFMHPSVYPNMTQMDQWDIHRDHCLDSIRQSLMCSADVSTVFYQWDPKQGFTLPDVRVTHTCRKWHDVRRWAMKHRLSVDLDPKEKADGAPIFQGLS